ncbi:zinc-dependent metalloprotease [Halorubrum sp. BOL3-1]|uniref:zinc-dependent metalloprotease n=1 Tax=Halorubrum sp. BOL3-1 TaxID=2497325 RepID=UPI00269B6BEC
MDILRSVRAVAEAEGPGVVDWDRAASAAKSATDPGSIALTDAERAGYAEDVRDARSRLATVAGIDFDVPDAVEVQSRHHWIDASVGTFRRVMDPIEAAAVGDAGGGLGGDPGDDLAGSDARTDAIDVVPDTSPGPVGSAPGAAFARDLSRIANTGSMAFALGFLARNVLGQYDPLLLADEPDADHGLYFVHPNIVGVAAALDVEYPRFRRWIAFHEVTHAAEFGAAPWLPEYLESRVERGSRG